MIPISDDNSGREKWPFVTVLLIVANVLVFLYEVSLSDVELDRFIREWGVIPSDISNGRDLHTLLSSMFLHGGWLHIGGNMLFLWIFGDNVEDYVGHLRFLLFYLLCGLAASVAHLAFNLNSTIPTLGASGAIAGVLGAYLLLFPGARILTLVPVFFVWLMELPAYVILIYWFALQLLQGTATLAESAPGGGVAWWAHVGGFVAGLILVKIVASRRRRYYVIRK